MAPTAEAQALPVALAAGETPGEAAASPRDDALVEACRKGERGAFDQLVIRHQRGIYRLCYRYVNNHEDANDLTQEVFLRAWRGIRRFRGRSAFSTWLYRIGVNTCLNFRASRRPPTQELPEAIADGRTGAVREAVSRLPEKQRATLILKIYHELTHQEVARILGSTVGTVKANLFHALGNLRKLVAEEDGVRP
jgi:RNA polymerase sigma-70 factor (ECF subfamily)